MTALLAPIDLETLSARLDGAVPAGYRAYASKRTAAALIEQGFDPKTLLILNLELQRLPRYDESERRFFLSGDGCGNYYFVDVASAPSKVRSWSHDPPGIEDTGISLAAFLPSAQQLDRIDHPIELGSLWLCRTQTYAESILDPIAMDEWIAAVRATRGLEYQGYRDWKNPFTGEEGRKEWPGRTRILGLEQSHIAFVHGRAHLTDTPVTRPIARRLANKLRANLLG